ncbi:MAG: hypothetical protein COV35_10470 [Alphaproteobacteria bacterium CG11_big_fil_rev_8_21_14_0_20_39_49]|nr:MAG: hypothetical protein COV35_10470 [Alphaproteobacteria bacterium CG11_big_fil_rev_8_21_14_0_20_39_49]
MINKQAKNIDLYKCHRSKWDNCVQKQHILSPSELEKMNKYKIEDDKKRFCTGRIITRTVASRYLKTDSNKIEILFNEHGKPYIKNSKAFFFNISHSGDWVVVGFSDYEIGVDIQMIDTGKKLNIDNIAKYAFHPDEIKYINDSEEEKHTRFYTIWSLKEAFVKAKGVGFYNNLEKLSILPVIKDNNTLIDGLSLSYKKIDEQHVLAIAFAKNMPLKVSEHEFQDLL